MKYLVSLHSLILDSRLVCDPFDGCICLFLSCNFADEELVYSFMSEGSDELRSLGRRLFYPRALPGLAMLLKPAWKRCREGEGACGEGETRDIVLQ